MGLNQTKAAKRLGLKLRTVQYYEKGERKGKKVTIPKSVSLACYALSCGVADVDFSTPLGAAQAQERSACSRTLTFFPGILKQGCKTIQTMDKFRIGHDQKKGIDNAEMNSQHQPHQAGFA